MPRNPEHSPLGGNRFAFLRGEYEYKGPDDARYEIRETLRHTLRNGWRIWRDLPEDQREQIFENFDIPEDSAAELEQDDIDKAREFRQGLIGWLAFLYAGTDHARNLFLASHFEREAKQPPVPLLDDEAPTLHFDFEQMLHEAVEFVAGSQGERVTSFDLTIETEPIEPEYRSFDTAELKARLESDNPHFSLAELNHLRREGVIESVDGYLDDHVDQAPPRGRMGAEFDLDQRAEGSDSTDE